MDLHRLRTLVAVADARSFTAAGRALGLSHSAVSLHIKDLEAALGLALVDRAVRPPALTERGVAIVEQARRMLAIAEDIRALGAVPGLVGGLSVGVVPTAMAGLVPPALVALREAHPRLRLTIRTGLSGDLADAVRAGALDAALATAPDIPLPGLSARPVAHEPIEAIAPADVPAGPAASLLAGRPFIWFSRQTWAGQQIERALAEASIAVEAVMEVDSLEAVEALVRAGLGVSVVPRRAGASRVGLRVAALAAPGLARTLALIAPPRHPRGKLIDALFAALVAAGGSHPPASIP